jgi:hypothetical protein
MAARSKAWRCADRLLENGTMRRIICFVLYMAMIIGGAGFVIMQLVHSGVIFTKLAAGSAMLAFFGGYLMWEDFLRPLVGVKEAESTDPGA